jgi:DnaJ domain
MSTETLEACYRTLGLAPNAGFDEVKYAYRVLVKRWHPDRFASDTDRQRQALERFYSITSAYKMLRARQAAVDVTRLHARRRRQRIVSWATRGAWCLGIGGLITVACYVFQPAFHHVTPPPSLVRPPVVLAQSVTQRDAVTVGSTKDVVRAVQGPPTWATDRMWEYGGSRLYFNAGRVTGWEIWPGSPLKVHLLPAALINPVPAG